MVQRTVSTKNVTILLVEDEQITALTQKAALERLGYTILIASDGPAAIAMVEQHKKLSIILMDMELGTGPYGAEVATRILARRNVPIVFLSSHTDPEFVRRADTVQSYGYVVKNSGTAVLDASIRIALSLHEARESARLKDHALASSERQYRQLFVNMTSGFALHEMVYDTEGKAVDYRFLAINPAFEAIVGKPAGDVVGRTVMELFPETEHYWIETYARVATDGETIQYTNYSKALDRSYEVVAFCPQRGQFAVMVRDVTESVRLRQQLEKSELLYRSIIENSRDGFLIIDMNGRFRLVNQAYCDMIGYTSDELLDMGIPDVDAVESPEESAEHVAKVIRNGHDRFETRQRNKNGTILDIEVSAHYRTDDGGWIFCFFKDITESRQLRLELDRRYREQERTLAELKNAIGQKDNLMRELQHRVKNNLNIAASLLGLEGQSAETPETRAIVARGSQRIRAISAMYEKLYLSPDLVSVNMEAYLSGIATSQNAAMLETDKVRLVVEPANLYLPSPTAMALGLIANELVINAVKHAFPDDRSGVIKICMSENTEEKLLHLTVSDNGIGNADGTDNAGTDSGNNTSVGYSILTVLVDQISGTLYRDSSAGTTVTVTVPYTGTRQPS